MCLKKGIRLNMENEIIEKNKEYIVDIIDNGYEGEGIAKINDFTVFVPTAIKGEKCKILIVKVHTTYAYGKILEIIERSEKRVEPDCSTYKRCGGCNLRHIEYQYTLKMKQQTVQNLISKSTKTPIRVNETIGMVQPYYYRNKLQYPVGLDKNKEIVMGVFAKRTHEIIPVSKCMIQNEKAEEIMGNSFTLLLITGLILTIVILIFKKPLLYLLGASDNTFSYANDYITIYLLGSVFVMISLGMNSFINSQGFGRIGMMTILVGAITNIILDPIFILYYIWE